MESILPDTLLGTAGIERVSRMFEGGSTDLSTLKLSKVRLSHGNGNKEVFMIQVDNCASVKSTTYVTTIMFSTDPQYKYEGAYFGDRVSRCTCPNGRLLCSHMAMTLSVLQLIQEFGSESSADFFLKSYPEPVKLIANRFIPSRYVYGKGCFWEKDDHT